MNMRGSSKLINEVTESDLVQLWASKRALDRHQKLYDAVREKLVKAMRQSKLNAVHRGEYVATIKDVPQVRPNFKEVLITLKGGKYVDRLIKRTKPTIIARIDVTRES